MAIHGKRAKQRKTREILLGTALFILVFSAIAGVSYYSMTHLKGLNPETLCPAEGPQGHYVLLIDKTSPLNFTQKQTFLVLMKELIEKKVPEGHLLSVFALDEDFKKTATPLVELCNPGDGAGKSEFDSSPKKLKAKYQSKFAEPMLRLSESLIANKPAKWSPIFEMLQLVGINGYRKQDVKGERRLIIISDMIQNTSQYSMYKEEIDYTTFASSIYGKKTQPDLNDVSVELHYLMNSPKIQTKRNLKFWEDYFFRAGARIVAAQTIEG